MGKGLRNILYKKNLNPIWKVIEMSDDPLYKDNP